MGAGIIANALGLDWRRLGDWVLIGLLAVAFIAVGVWVLPR
jgi:hypothetical protein